MGSRPGDPRSTQAWRRLRKQVLAQESDCWICGRPVDFDAPKDNPWSVNVDHIIPVDAAPHLALERSNVRLAHRACHSHKRTRLVDVPPVNGTRRAGSNAAALPPHSPYDHRHSREWTPEPTRRDCPSCIADCEVCTPRR